MPCLTDTPDFQSRLRQAYRDGGLVPEDLLIFRAATQPAVVLVGNREVVPQLACGSNSACEAPTADP